MTQTIHKVASPSVSNFHNHEVRIVLRDGEPWFVAADVCVALGYRDADRGTRILGTHQKGRHNVPPPAAIRPLSSSASPVCIDWCYVPVSRKP
jgi:prophage antirepressor-like protein